MVDFSRRGFLAQMSITTGVGLAGGLGLHKLLASDTSANAQPLPIQPQEPSTPLAQTPLALDGVTLTGPMLVHVRDVANAEIAMMVGTRELIYRDPELVSRLVQTAATADKRSEA